MASLQNRSRARLVGAALCALLSLQPLAASAAGWGPWQGRAALGGELSATSFGIFDLGLRKGPLSIEILTDTLDIHFSPSLRRGRAWVGLRVETFAAGLMISPWTAGAPDPSRAWNAGYSGLDGGWQHYLPAGFYAGLQGSARLYLLWARENTTVPPPGLVPVFSAEAVVGHYTPTSHVQIRAGGDAELDRLAPHVFAEASLRPDWAIAPRIELRAGWAMNQDAILRTRLGGLNPYVVPLAGAAWAEFWVENYVALRVGPSLRTPLPGRSPHSLELSLVSDIVGFDGTTAVGFGALGSWRYRRLFLNASLGVAPWLQRQPGLVPLAGFVLFGADWGAFFRL